MILVKNTEYVEFFNHIKQQIQLTQSRASLAVNKELIELYWRIGHRIIKKQKKSKWGSKLIQQLSHDLKNSFPGMKGLSVRNLERMRQFARLFPDNTITTQAVSQLPWGHILLLIQKINNDAQRQWYIAKCIEHGWSRSILHTQIQLKTYERQGIAKQKLSNFEANLPAPQSELAHEMLKDPYCFDFLTIDENTHERTIESELTQHITKFLLELGAGFSYVGKQVPIIIEDDEFHIDMLFYHLKLRCYIVIELKARKFKPQDVGQLSFYLSAVDDLMKHADDKPTIGLLLCQQKNSVVAEYALQSINKPMGISEYELTQAIPKELESSLPSIEQIETELSQ